MFITVGAYLGLTLSHKGIAKKAANYLFSPEKTLEKTEKQQDMI